MFQTVALAQTPRGWVYLTPVARFTKHSQIYEFKSLVNSYETMPENIRGILVYELMCGIQARRVLSETGPRPEGRHRRRGSNAVINQILYEVNHLIPFLLAFFCFCYMCPFCCVLHQNPIFIRTLKVKAIHKQIYVEGLPRTLLVKPEGQCHSYANELLQKKYE